MANESSVYSSAAKYMYIFSGSVDHMIGIPTNCWALWLIVSGKPSLIGPELLTLNLVIMELSCSMCFFLSLIQIFCEVSFHPLTHFYEAVAVMGRVLFQCHVCVDRYLAVVHPMVFIRYKPVKYRGACLAALWLVVIWSGLCNIYLPPNATFFSISSCVLLAPALFIELFCSLSIIRILRRPSPGNKEAPEKKGGNQQKNRAVKIICVVLVMLLFNMVPFTTVPLFLRIKMSHVNVLPITFTLATVGSSVQALLFLSRSGKLPCKGKS